MPLKRTEHWATRALHHFLQSRATAPFVFGTNDCCLFPADGIQAMTGVDIAGDFRGKYHDKASAFALIKTVTGGSTVADAAAHCARAAGLVEWPHPRLAQRGDLVVMANSDGEQIAGLVHLNGRHLVTVGEYPEIQRDGTIKTVSGLVLLPVSRVQRAWKV